MAKYNPNHKILVAIALVSLPILGYLVGANQDILNNKFGLSPSCKYDLPPKSSYLISYVVNQGDSLLSIAEEQVGYTAGANEIVELNKDRLPYLSLDNPFLEVSQLLYLPPTEIRHFTGDLIKVNGKLINKGDNVWKVDGGDGKTFEITHDEYTVYKDKNQEGYRNGDCLNVVAEKETGKARLVSPQP